MAVGYKRTVAARVSGTLGFACGLLGLLAGLTGHAWKFGVTGWFTSGCLLGLLGILALVDGAIAAQRAR